MSELPRRLVHATGAIVPLAYVAGVATWDQVQVIAVAGTVLALTLEAFRLFVGLELALYDQLTREYEQHNLAGYALYTISGTAVILLTDPTVAVPAVLMLALGDPVSGILSTGELRTVKRPLVLGGMFAVSFAIAYPFVGPVAALAGATGATLADGIKPVIRGYVVDDNLTIAPIAAVCMLMALRFVG